MNQPVFCLFGDATYTPNWLTAEEKAEAHSITKMQLPENRIWLLAQQGDALEDSLKTLRGTPETAFDLIYVSHPASLTDSAITLSDGLVKDRETMLKNWSTWTYRYQQLHNPKPEYPDQKLISYLSLSPQRKMSPVVDITGSGFYQYPLLNIFTEGEATRFWLQRLLRRELLLPEKLINRLRQCPECHSSYLNYIDFCPQCRSINITMEKDLHCFFCGHVENEAVFHKGDTLTCPNCLKQLRHIGTDYDRPLETYRCRNCHLLFAEPLVEAQCLSCNVQHDPDELDVLPVYEYGISDRALTYFYDYTVMTVNEQVADIHHSDPGLFIRLLGWHAQLCRSRPEPSYPSLVYHLHFTFNTSPFSGLQQVEVIVEQLQQQLAPGDLICPWTDVDYLLLLPNCTEDKQTQLDHSLATSNADIKLTTHHQNITDILTQDRELLQQLESWLQSGKTK